MVKVVAVTGASGFIGSHVVQQLLDKGHTVRACVRDAENEAKTAHLKALAAGSTGELQLFSADLLVEGSFDDAFAGASAVVHTAAVVLLAARDAQKTIIDPSVKGTRNILSGIAHSNSVKRLVHTSSVAAVHTQGGNPATVYDESHWNEGDAATDPCVRAACGLRAGCAVRMWCFPAARLPSAYLAPSPASSHAPTPSAPTPVLLAVMASRSAKRSGW